MMSADGSAADVRVAAGAGGRRVVALHKAEETLYKRFDVAARKTRKQTAELCCRESGGGPAAVSVLTGERLSLREGGQAQRQAFERQVCFN